VTSLTLLIPEKTDSERDAVAEAWEAAGGTVVRVGRFWEPPPVDRMVVRVYGPDTFCLVLAEKLNLWLLSPPDRVLADAPAQIVKRRIRIAALGSLAEGDVPSFVKPVVPKQFRGAVYASLADLAEETRGLGAETEVIISEIVSFVAEARAFVLDGHAKTCAIYEGAGDVKQAAAFAGAVAHSLELPKTCVVDVGLLPDGRWALVECNATWGAGLNGCDASAVVECTAAASGANS
jgi:hypothetical protein